MDVVELKGNFYLRTGHGEHEKFLYRKGLHRRADIPEEHWKHPYFQAHVVPPKVLGATPHPAIPQADAPPGLRVARAAGAVKEQAHGEEHALEEWENEGGHAAEEGDDFDEKEKALIETMHKAGAIGMDAHQVHPATGKRGRRK